MEFIKNVGMILLAVVAILSWILAVLGLRYVLVEDAADSFDGYLLAGVFTVAVISTAAFKTITDF
ncbi:hypothetical protein KIV65_gp62 [Mycobacterium phage Anthony]|uniref:Uncharacterized protein n=1 Tax=Mycobacterium phage Anthony TaxID=2599857 RepID=A0A5J6TII5_9CAUD|nr:hypothetical protein KIV65_gp62 [Mycobacterium phage Anthony]QFG10406.1 hypothetical protein PBI_ANTHONY_35 [Mycobacterium phage Anthony]